MGKCKSLYRGVFNYRQTIKTLYCHAYTKTQAWAIMCRRLAEQDGVGILTVMRLFNGKRDNYEITQEMEIKEVDG